jgi:hypothetical protein
MAHGSWEMQVVRLEIKIKSEVYAVVFPNADRRKGAGYTGQAQRANKNTRDAKKYFLRSLLSYLLCALPRQHCGVKFVASFFTYRS